MSRSAEDLVGGLTAVSLEELDARAALLQRADRKYLLGWDAFATLLDRLAADHDVLEIAGRRVFAYSTVYFDSPDLRCFHDHVEGRRPRFKARTRLYRDTGGCQFEVKLATAGRRTDKRQVEHRSRERPRSPRRPSASCARRCPRPGWNRRGRSGRCCGPGSTG